MQEYLSNEFSFGSQQITTRATLGSVAVWVPEPLTAQGEEETEWARSTYAKKMILKLC